MTSVRGDAFPALDRRERRQVRGRALLAALLALATAPAAPASEPGLPPDFDRGARLLESGSAVEYWDLTALFDSGDRLLARFMITNQGPGDRTAIALTHLITPDGRTHDFRNGRREGRWTLSPDQLRLKIGSSVLDLRGPLQTFELDSNKQGVKIHLEIPIGAAASHAEGIGPKGYQSDLLELAGPIEGTVWIEGMEAPRTVRGRAALTHTWMGREEHALSARRIELFQLESEPALYVSHLTSPSGEHFTWAAALDAQGGGLRSNQGEVSMSGRARGSQREYSVPEVICLTDSWGNTRARLGSILLENDPHDAIPLALRLLFFSGSRPRRTWADATFDVTFAPDPVRPPIRQQGPGLATVTFLNPLKASSEERTAKSETGAPCESAY